MPCIDDWNFKASVLLPCNTVILGRIQERMGQDPVSVTEILEMVKYDPALICKIIRCANSPWGGLPRAVSSLNNAVVICGLERVSTLIYTALHMHPVEYRLDPEFDFLDFWRHSITVALICESITRYLFRYTFLEIDDLFCAGILHDIGKLILNVSAPNSFDDECTIKDTNTEEDVFENKKQLYSHTAIGKQMAQFWRFPDTLVHAIAYHHAPSQSPANTRAVAIVHIADIMVHALGLHADPDKSLQEIDPHALEQIGLAPEYLRVIASQSFKREKELESLLKFVS